MHVHPGKALQRAIAAVLLTFTFASSAFAAAAIWPSSRVPFFDIDAQPMVGATVEFFNCETSTPQVVYEDSDLATPLDQPIEADARGMFTTIFLNATPGCYRVRVEDADGALVYDDDGIAVFQSATFVPPEAGETSEELLFRTGMLEPFYGTSSPSGWVRCNGRTIGNAASGATERANADTEDLYVHLWTVDATLTVSSGRGATAAGDYAANKTIALPDCRDRTMSALAAMGNSDAGLVADSYVDGGETSSDLGATAGLDDVTLTIANLAAHTHPGTTASNGDHTHGLNVLLSTSEGGSAVTAYHGGTNTHNSAGAGSTTSTGAHTHTFTTDSTGGGTAHNNMPPTMFVTVLIKL
jgi:microcystin-dependent protein